MPDDASGNFDTSELSHSSMNDLGSANDETLYAISNRAVNSARVSHVLVVGDGWKLYPLEREEAISWLKDRNPLADVDFTSISEGELNEFLYY